MPMKPVLYTGMDLIRAREIVHSLPSLNALSDVDAESVARTIALCFAKGREQGLHQALQLFQSGEHPDPPWRLRDPPRRED